MSVHEIMAISWHSRKVEKYLALFHVGCEEREVLVDKVITRF